MLASIYNHASSVWFIDANPGLPQAFPVQSPILPKVRKKGRFPEPQVQCQGGNIPLEVLTWWRTVRLGLQCHSLSPPNLF